VNSGTAATLEATLEENQYLKLIYSDALQELAFVREDHAVVIDEKQRLTERLAVFESSDMKRYVVASSDEGKPALSASSL